ncbi:MAG: signal peptidase II [Actinobacteria bacterium]|nr:signal peptidase II [Actinomycetota bacterium]
MQTEGRAPIRSSGANCARRLFIIITVSIFALDLISKNWAFSYLQYREPVRVIGDFLQLTFSTNSGAAFSLVGDATLILSSLKLCVAAFILYFIRKVTSASWAIALALLLGGVLGNLMDRAFRPPAPWRGEVIDWIELPNWTVFNIADSAIVISAILMSLLAIRKIEPYRRGI